MPTNKERQSIAENLRIMTSYGCKYAEQFYELLKETVMDSWDFHEFGDVADRLADLIEPEHDRTCHMEPTFIGPATLFNMQEYECSECGKSTFSQVFGDDEDVPKYCSECGAKVV